MNSQSAGEMLMQALKKLVGAVLRVAALAIAWCIEIVGKFLFWISEQIKRNAK